MALSGVVEGGNYLLNIGPDGKGRVPESCVKHFHELGEWVERNADAIFGTSRWNTFNENVNPKKAKFRLKPVLRTLGLRLRDTQRSFTKKGPAEWQGLRYLMSIKLYACLISDGDESSNLSSPNQPRPKMTALGPLLLRERSRCR